jgi:hypothetical protein|tara:strand:+ start:94 stop:231 length:138 start_codon:yes stop_codon:yes gene_type:complete
MQVPPLKPCIKKAMQVVSFSDEMLEGNDIRRLTIAAKYQTETLET